MIAPKEIEFSQIIRPMQTLEIQRSPIYHVCECGYRQLLILPNHQGAVVWACLKCHKHNRIDFHAEILPTVGHGQIHPKREPIQHECQTCGDNDLLVLPTGFGEMRWTCKCKSEWIIKFQPRGGKLGHIAPRIVL